MSISLQIFSLTGWAQAEMRSSISLFGVGKEHPSTCSRNAVRRSEHTVRETKDSKELTRMQPGLASVATCLDVLNVPFVIFDSIRKQRTCYL